MQIPKSESKKFSILCTFKVGDPAWGQVFYSMLFFIGEEMQSSGSLKVENQRSASANCAQT